MYTAVHVGRLGERGLPVEDSAAFRRREVTITPAAAPRGANAAVVILALTEDRSGILAGPRQCLTDEVRRWVEANRDGLVRRLLFARALSYYERHVIDTGGSAFSPAARAGYAELSRNDEDLNGAFLDAGLKVFEEVLQRWLKRGLAVYQKALQAERALQALQAQAAEPPTTGEPPSSVQTALAEVSGMTVRAERAAG